MCVNNLPKVATQWNSGATRDSNRGRRVPNSKCANHYTTEPRVRYRTCIVSWRSGLHQTVIHKSQLAGDGIATVRAY